MIFKGFLVLKVCDFYFMWIRLDVKCFYCCFEDRLSLGLFVLLFKSFRDNTLFIYNSVVSFLWLILLDVVIFSCF